MTTPVRAGSVSDVDLPDTDGKMVPEVKTLWVEALRSGEYEQGDGQLNEDNKFCCLGVLCDVAVKSGLDIKVETYDQGLAGKDKPYLSYDGDAVFLPKSVMKWAGIGTSDGYIGHMVQVFNPNGPTTHNALTGLNDSGVPFKDIADVIEKEF